ncbi:MAG: hypothetical protein QM753_00285 [Thermomicrobiales bacterium]
MLADAVVAIVDDDRLPAILAVIHRNGLGHIARVMKRERGDFRAQLRRASIPVEQAPDTLDDAGRILLVTAAARSQMTADLLLRNHAIAAWVITKQGFWRDIDDRTELVAATPDLVSATSPDIRLPQASPTPVVPPISLTEDAPGDTPS